MKEGFEKAGLLKKGVIGSSGREEPAKFVLEHVKAYKQKRFPNLKLDVFPENEHLYKENSMAVYVEGSALKRSDKHVVWMNGHTMDDEGHYYTTAEITVPALAQTGTGIHLHFDGKELTIIKLVRVGSRLMHQRRDIGSYIMDHTTGRELIETMRRVMEKLGVSGFSTTLGEVPVITKMAVAGGEATSTTYGFAKVHTLDLKNIPETPIKRQLLEDFIEHLTRLAKSLSESPLSINVRSWLKDFKRFKEDLELFG